MLRAVNVSGARKMKMSELAALCSDRLGCRDVVTYLQSGNVVLTSSKAATTLARELAAAISEEFGYLDVTVLPRTASQLAETVSKNPFVARGCDVAKLHATFVDKAKVDLRGIDSAAYLPDEVAMGDGVVYVHCPNGYGRTKLNNGFLERKTAARATTRNWKTVNKLLEMTRQA